MAVAAEPAAVAGPCEAGHARRCLAYWGVADAEFAARVPDAADVEITREEMAGFVARALVTAGDPLADGPDAFADDGGSPFETHINRLAAAAVVNGVRSGLYAPEEAVSRAEAAAILVRGFDRLSEHPLADTGENVFGDDDQSPFHEDVNLAASLGLLRAGSDGRFRPRDPLLEDDLVNALDRWLALAVEEDLVEVPDAPRSLQLP